MKASTAWLLGAALALPVVWAQACATAPDTPSRVPERPRTPFSVESPAAAAVSASGLAGGPVLEFADFAPLLSFPEMEPVALAVQDEDLERAAAELTKLIAQDAFPPEDNRKVHFLLGRLRERAEDWVGAAEAYGVSAAEPWELSPYISLALGRVYSRLGHYDAAIRDLEAVPRELPIFEDSQALLARAAEQVADYDRAIASYQAYLVTKRRPADYASLSLRLARALVARQAQRVEKDAADTGTEDLVAAVTWARRARWGNTSDEEKADALQLETRALAKMPKELRAQHTSLSLDDQLGALTTLVDARRFTDADVVATSTLASLKHEQKFSESGCEIQLLRSNALAGAREWGKAVDSLSDTLRFCKGTDFRARALFTAGKYAFSDKRYDAATRYFAQLEQEAPEHRLADDARLKAAIAYLEMGVEARYTELLATMPEAYPHGDMVLDGVFGLAMRRMEKGDWSGAASILDSAASVAEGQDKERGTEYAGRERYFRARAWLELGETERGLKELETIVRDLPLSYYMLHAYTRLKLQDPARAERAKAEGIRRSEQQPFTFEYQPQFEQVGFRRAMELLRQGELHYAENELASLGLLDKGTTPSVLWAVALLYDRAGALDLSHRVARGLLTDWLQRWPAGDWRRAWELAFPRPHLDVVQKQAKKNEIQEALVYGVMREESQFDEDIVSPAGAYGLMQLIKPTAAHYGKKEGIPYSESALRRPAYNIALGSVVLKSFRRPFGKNPLLCIPAYNAGPGRPKRWKRERPNVDFDVWVELIPFRETRRYTHRVIAARAAYGYLYDTTEAPDEWLTLPIRLAD